MAPGQALPETDQLGLGVRLHPNDRGIDDPAAVKRCDEFVGGGPSVYDFPVLQGSPGSGVLTLSASSSTPSYLPACWRRLGSSQVNDFGTSVGFPTPIGSSSTSSRLISAWKSRAESVPIRALDQMRLAERSRRVVPAMLRLAPVVVRPNSVPTIGSRRVPPNPARFHDTHLIAI